MPDGRAAGILRKMRRVDREDKVHGLLEHYLDEDSKPKTAQANQAAIAQLRAGAAEPMLAQPRGAEEAHLPIGAGLRFFGFMAEVAHDHGLDSVHGHRADAAESLTNWWCQSVCNRRIKAHHFVASFAPEISDMIAARGYPVDAALMSTFHDTMSTFVDEFHPDEEIGWVVGCHHDSKYPHIHALVHPLTKQGNYVRTSDQSRDEPAADHKLSYLRTDFRQRCADVLTSLTPDTLPSDETKSADDSDMLELRYAYFDEYSKNNEDWCERAVERVEQTWEQETSDEVAEWLRTIERDRHEREMAREMTKKAALSPPATTLAALTEMKEAILASNEAQLGRVREVVAQVIVPISSGSGALEAETEGAGVDRMGEMLQELPEAGVALARKMRGMSYWHLFLRSQVVLEQWMKVGKMPPFLEETTLTPSTEQVAPVQEDEHDFDTGQTEGQVGHDAIRPDVTPAPLAPEEDPPPQTKEVDDSGPSMEM